MDLAAAAGFACGAAAACALLAHRRARQRRLRVPPPPPRLHHHATDGDAEGAVYRGDSAALAAALCALPAAWDDGAGAASFTLVDDEPALAELARALQLAPVVAIDVEHSRGASFHGVVCTVQLSVPGADFVVDCLLPAVRAGLGPLLARACSRRGGKLLLVHAAANDVRWLHAGFGVSLTAPVFDTAVAARLLGEPGAALGSLARTRLGVHVDKRLQTADWRVRPLPPAMLAYARRDSALLLPLAGALARELVAAAPSVAGGGGGRAAEAAAPPGGAPPLVHRALQLSHAVTLHRYDARAAEVFQPAPCVRLLMLGRARRGGDGRGGSAAHPPPPPPPPELLHALVTLARVRHQVALDADACPEQLLEGEAMVAAVRSLLRQPSSSSVAAGAAASTTGSGLARSRSVGDTVGGAVSTGDGNGALLLPSPSVAAPPPPQLHAADVAATLALHLPPATSALGRGLLTAATAALVQASCIPLAERQEQVMQWHRAPPNLATPPTLPHPGLDGGADGSTGARVVAAKEQRAERIFVTRAAPLYSNIRLVAPDGTLLACVSQSKAEWYLAVGAADALDGGGEPMALSRPPAAAAAAKGEGEEGVAGCEGVGGEVGEHEEEEEEEEEAGEEGEAEADPSSSSNHSSSLHRLVDSEATRATAPKRPRRAPVRPTPFVDAALARLEAAAAAPSAVPPGPLRLRLRQPPKGLGHSGDAFHLTTKDNQCVVCGVRWQEDIGLNRFYVVPHVYRAHFPLAAKSYASHDVVLTCCRCHVRADQATAALGRAIAAELGVPVTAKEAAQRGLLVAAGRGDDDAAAATARQAAEEAATAAASALKRAANALCNQQAKGRRLPPERVAALQQTVRDVAWLLPLLIDDAALRSREAAAAAAVASAAGHCGGGGAASPATRKRAAAAAAAARALDAVTAALQPLCNALATVAAQSGRSDCVEAGAVIAATHAATRQPRLPPHVPLGDAALRSMQSLHLASVSSRATALLLQRPCAAATSQQQQPQLLQPPGCGSGPAGGDDAAAAPATIPLPPPPTWNAAERIVRAVTLGPHDPLWPRAAAFYPPAIPPPCDGCTWQAAAVAADSDGALLQTGAPDHHAACNRRVGAVAGTPLPPLQQLQQLQQLQLAASSCGGGGGDSDEGGGVPTMTTTTTTGVSGLPLEAEDRLTRFVQRWRANFLRRLHPRAMPAHWAVSFRVFTGGIRKRGKAEAALVQEALLFFDREAAGAGTARGEQS